MKLHLPLGLRRAVYHTFIALLTGAVTLAAPAWAEGDEPTSGTETTEPEYRIDEREIFAPNGEGTKVYITPVTGSADNTYFVKIKDHYHLNAENVTWEGGHNFGNSASFNVGTSLTKATLTLKQAEGATGNAEYKFGQNMFIGCPGWGITVSETYKPLTGVVNVEKGATLELYAGYSSASQLNVGAGGDYKAYGHEGILNVAGGTAKAGNLYASCGYWGKGTINVLDGGAIRAVYHGKLANGKDSGTGVLAAAYYQGSLGYINVTGGSTVSSDYITYIALGYQDAVTQARNDGKDETIGTLTVTGNSTADLGYLYVGYYGYAHGTITVGDADSATPDMSTLTAAQTILGHENEAFASLTVNGYAIVDTGSTYIGYKTGSTGSITVDGATNDGSGATTAPLLDVSADTVIGYNGGTGSISVINGGRAEFASYVIAGGWNKSTGTMTVASGGSADIAGGLYLGYTAGATGETTVSGADSNLTAYWGYVGREGVGTLTVNDGATVAFTGVADAKLTLGVNADSKGVVNVDGEGSSVTTTNSWIGNLGEGELNITNGASFSADVLSIAWGTDAVGRVNVDATSSLALTGDMYVGEQGIGTLTVADGGVLDVAGDISVSSGSTLTKSNLVLKDGQTMALDSGATINGSVTAVAGSTVDMLAATITSTLLVDGATLMLDMEQLATVGTLTTGSATATVDVGDIASLGLGTYTLLNYGSQSVNVANLTLANLPSASNSRASYKFQLSGSALQLVIAGKAVDLVWNPEKATWSAGEGGDDWNILNAMGTSSFAHYDNVTFDKGDEVSIEGEVNPGRVTVSLAAGETLTLKGDGSITGTGMLSKDGGGTLVLNTANSYSGGTNITGDGFILDDTKTDFASASTVKLGHDNALGSGDVTINGGVLDMNLCAISNDVTVNGPAVILAADKYEGQLTINAGGELTCAHMMDGGAHDNHSKGHITLNLAQDLLFNGGHIEESYTLKGIGGVVVDAGEGGTAELDGTHEYKGDTLVKSGTLLLSGSIDGSDITVSSGATLDLHDGSFDNGSLSVESGATLIGGTQDRDLNGDQKLTLGAGSSSAEGEAPEPTTLTGDTTASQNSQVVISSGAQVELKPDSTGTGSGEGKLTLTDKATVTVEKDATLALTSGTELNLGTQADTTTETKLVLAEGATVTVEQGAKLDLSTEGAQIDVTVDQGALDAATDADEATYVVVSGTGNVISYANTQDMAAQVKVDESTLNEYRTPTVNATTEKITITVGRADLVWNTNTNTGEGQNKGVWKAGQDSDVHWDLQSNDSQTNDGQEKFFHRDNVAFAYTIEGEQEIAIEGTVKPGGIIVEQENDLSLVAGEDGAGIGGTGGITMVGAGNTLKLATTNTNSGGTTIYGAATVLLAAEGALGSGAAVLCGEDYVDEDSVRTVMNAGKYTVENDVILIGATELVNASGLKAITVMGGSDTKVESGLVLGKDVVLTVDGTPTSGGMTTFALAIDEPAPVQTGTTSTFRGAGVTLDGLTLTFPNQGRIGYAGACTLTENWATLLDLRGWGEPLSKTDEIGLIQFTDEATTPLTGSQYVDSGAAGIKLDNEVLEQYAHLRYDENGWVVLYFTAPTINEQLASQLSRNQSRAYNTLIAVAEDNMEELATDPLSIAAARAANAETAGELKELLDSVSGEEYATMMASQIEGNLAHLRRLRGHMGHGHLLGNSKSGLAAFANAYGDTAEVDADATGAGYNRNEWGAQVGVEQEIAEGQGIGLALSVGRANVTPTGGVRYHEDNQHLDAYHFMRKGGWENRVSVGVGLHEHDLARRGNGGSMMSAGNVDGTSFNFTEEISYRLPVTESVTLRPFFAIESSVNSIDSFTEGSGSSLALCGDSQDAWATDLTLGLSAETRFAVLERAPRATAELHAGITASVGDTTSDLRMHFAGAPGHSFEQSSADRNRWGMNLGAGVNIPVTRFTSVYANAEAIFRGDSSSFDAQLGVHINF